jgi:hypothetical protein
MKLWTLATAALFAATIPVSSSIAETITLTSVGMTTGVTGINVSAANVGSTNQAGLFQWTVTSPGDVGGSSIGPLGTQINTVCIQMGQNFSSGSTYTYTVSPIDSGAPIGGVDAGYIDSSAAAQLQALANSYAGYLSLSGTKTINGASYSAGEIAAAFQLSVWEIEYDGGSGLNSASASAPETFPGANYFSSGNLTASASNGSAGAKAISLAGYFLNNFTLNPSGADNTYTVFALTNADRQDQFFGVAHAVPLPAALPLGGSLLVGLGILGRIRSKRRH